MNQRKIWVLRGRTYGDFDTGYMETLMAAATKEKANQVKKILEKFIQEDFTEEAKRQGYTNDIECYDFMFGFFLRNDSYMRNKLLVSLSCAMNNHEAREFIETLINKGIYVHTKCFDVEELFFYC